MRPVSNSKTGRRAALGAAVVAILILIVGITELVSGSNPVAGRLAVACAAVVLPSSYLTYRSTDNVRGR